MCQQADVALTIDLDDNADHQLSFSVLQGLRHLEDKIFPLTAALRASVAVVDWLKGETSGDGKSKVDNAIPPAWKIRLTLASDRLRGSLASAEILRHRMGGIIHLVSQP